MVEMKKYEYHAWYRYDRANEKSYWEGVIETDDFNLILAEEEIKNKDRRVFYIDWR